MANLGDLQIQAKITVSEETARRCCDLLSIYCTDNPHLEVRTERFFSSDGVGATVGLWLNHPKVEGDE